MVLLDILASLNPPLHPLVYALAAANYLHSLRCSVNYRLEKAQDETTRNNVATAVAA